jgi:hypothetical protein
MNHKGSRDPDRIEVEDHLIIENADLLAILRDKPAAAVVA